jgi:hypothetical protein
MQSLFAELALYYCDLSLPSKVLLSMVVLFLLCLSLMQAKAYQAQHMASSNYWFLENNKKNIFLVNLLGNSFVSRYCLILNWLPIGSKNKKHVMILLRWQYDNETWRNYRRSLSQFKKV